MKTGGTMKTIAALCLAVSVCLLTSCSSQSPSSSSHSAAQSASAASVGGCNVDANAICESIRNQPIVDAQTGLSLDHRALAERSARTTKTFENLQIPNGSLLQVGCEMNAQHNTVTYAHLLPGAPLSTTDVAWLKAHNLCTD